jgi:hypothetical protein
MPPIDVDALAGAGALVAVGGLEPEPEPAELAQPDPGQDCGGGRQRRPTQVRVLLPTGPRKVPVAPT